MEKLKGTNQIKNELINKLNLSGKVGAMFISDAIEEAWQEGYKQAEQDTD